jgi:hypothetical protein
LFALCSSGRGRGGSSGTLGGRSGTSIIACVPIDCSTSSGIPEQVICCYAEMGKLPSNIDGGGSSRCTSNGPTPYFSSVPIWARSINSTGIQKRCPYRYWHHKLVQYQYGQGPLPLQAFQNGARAWISTGIGTVHYRYWHSSVVPVPVLANMHLDSIPV